MSQQTSAAKKIIIHINSYHIHQKLRTLLQFFDEPPQGPAPELRAQIYMLTEPIEFVAVRGVCVEFLGWSNLPVSD